ncbi:PEP/pyruvate-binding domain-containing protein [bacterium]
MNPPFPYDRLTLILFQKKRGFSTFGFKGAAAGDRMPRFPAKNDPPGRWHIRRPRGAILSDPIHYLLESTLRLLLPVFGRLADSFIDSASTYFFMALFVPSFVVVITVILYFIAYFLITAAATLAVNTFSSLAGLPLVAQLAIIASAPAAAYMLIRRWKARRARPPSGVVAPLARLDSSVAAEYGAKAASLGEVAAAWLRVPFGFAVSHSIFESFMRRNKIEHLSGAGKDDEDLISALHVMRDSIRKGVFPITGALLLRAAYLVLWLRGGLDPSFIVRSSFGGEDAPGKLAPGQYGSFGARGYKKMLEAIRECWCTYYTERAYHYREKMEIPQEPKLSFIAQVHLRMDLIGTAAAANPATGHREEVVVDVSAPPEDPRSVSEQSDAETFVYNIADAFPDPPADPLMPFLPELAGGLHALDARCEGAPIVEWAWCGEKLFFLQFRPLAGLPDVETYLSSGMVEIANEPLTPMAFSMIESERTLDSFITEPIEKYMGGSPAGDILKKIGSRVYARFTALVELSESLSPGPAELKVFVRMCGEQENEIRRFIGRFDAYLSRIGDMNYDNADVDELLKTFSELNELMQGRGTGHQAMAAHLAQSLSALLETVLKPLGVSPADARALPVYEDGCVALRRAELLADISSATVDDAPGVREKTLKTYMEEFGFLAPADETDPSVPRISERLEEFARMFAAPVAGAEVDQKDKKGKDKKKSYHKHLRGAMRRCGGQNLVPWDTIIFRRLYRLIRTYSTLREELRYRLLRGWAMARKLLLEIAAREPYASALKDAELIFFLTVDELAPDDVPGAVAEAEKRRRAFEADTVKPHRAVLHIGPDGEILDDEKPEAAPPGEGVYRGRAASSGTAAGIARLVARPEDVEKIEDGDIAVVDVCSPWMSMLFSRAAGVVALSGGVVSHLALAAREYGVPIVVGVRGVAGEDLDGLRLEIDTGAECVRVIKD